MLMETPRTQMWRMRPCNKKKKLNLKELPMDMVVEILKRVPAKSVCHIRCVSKKLLSIVDSPSFVTLHSTFLLDPDSHLRPDPPQLILRQIYSYLSNSMSTLHSLHYHHSNAQGNQLNVREFLQSSQPSFYNVHFVFRNLFCMKQIEHAIMFLVNPFRGEVLRLPPCHSYAQQVYGPSSKVLSVRTGMGFDSITNTYKILRVTKIMAPSAGTDTCKIISVAQVLELGKSLWREVDSIPTSNSLIFFKSICAYGDMHWLCYTTREGISGHHILSFDFKKEDFFWIPSPYTLPKRMWQLHLITFRGYMAIVDTTSGLNIEIWVMKDYSKKQWVLDYSINIHMLELDPEFEFYQAACSEWEHGILFINKRGSITVFLDLRGPVVAKIIFKCPTDRRDECYRIMSLNGGLISLKSYANLVEAEEPAAYSNWTEGEASGKSFFYLKTP